MIEGRITPGLEAILRLRVSGPHGDAIEVDAIIDTGFSGSLSLPPALADSLKLGRRISGGAFLADGLFHPFNTYRGWVDWHGVRHPIVVSAIGTEILIGMKLLANHEMRMEIAADGVVELSPLQR